MNLFSTAVVITIGAAVSLVTSTIVASGAYRARGEQATRQRQEIAVKGFARMPVSADLGVWRRDVTAEAGDLPAAFSLLEQRVRRVRDSLARAGLAPDGIELSAIGTRTHYTRDEHGRTTRRVESYALSRRVTVTSTNMQRVDRTSGEVTSPIKDGVAVRSQPPQSTCTKVSELKMEILGRADGPPTAPSQARREPA